MLINDTASNKNTPVRPVDIAKKNMVTYIVIGPMKFGRARLWMLQLQTSVLHLSFSSPKYQVGELETISIEAIGFCFQKPEV